MEIGRGLRVLNQLDEATAKRVTAHAGLARDPDHRSRAADASLLKQSQYRPQLRIPTNQVAQLGFRTVRVGRGERRAADLGARVKRDFAAVLTEATRWIKPKLKLIAIAPRPTAIAPKAFLRLPM